MSFSKWHHRCPKPCERAMETPFGCLGALSKGFHKLLSAKPGKCPVSKAPTVSCDGDKVPKLNLNFLDDVDTHKVKSSVQDSADSLDEINLITVTRKDRVSGVVPPLDLSFLDDDTPSSKLSLATYRVGSVCEESSVPSLDLSFKDDDTHSSKLSLATYRVGSVCEEDSVPSLNLSFLDENSGKTTYRITKDEDVKFPYLDKVDLWSDNGSIKATPSADCDAYKTQRMLDRVDLWSEDSLSKRSAEVNMWCDNASSYRSNDNCNPSLSSNVDMWSSRGDSSRGSFTSSRGSVSSSAGSAWTDFSIPPRGMLGDVELWTTDCSVYSAESDVFDKSTASSTRAEVDSAFEDEVAALPLPLHYHAVTPKQNYGISIPSLDLSFLQDLESDRSQYDFPSVQKYPFLATAPTQQSKSRLRKLLCSMKALTR